MYILVTNVSYFAESTYINPLICNFFQNFYAIEKIIYFELKFHKKKYTEHSES